MPKRKHPSGELYSPVQCKIHVDQRVMDESSFDSEKNMQLVFDKTIRLLQNGSKLLNKKTEKEIICECHSSKISQNQLNGRQLLIDHDGKLCSQLPSLPLHSTSSSSSSATSLDATMANEKMEVDQSQPTANHSGVTAVCQPLLFPTHKKSFCYRCGSTCMFDRTFEKCNWCYRDACQKCINRCHVCQHFYCSLCSNINYDESYERLICIACKSL